MGEWSEKKLSLAKAIIVKILITDERLKKLPVVDSYLFTLFNLLNFQGFQKIYAKISDGSIFQRLAVM